MTFSLIKHCISNNKKSTQTFTSSFERQWLQFVFESSFCTTTSGKRHLSLTMCYVILLTAGTSISSQFLVRANQGTLMMPTLRNVAVINAAKQTRADSETTRKREELNRRIEETRRKLQSVSKYPSVTQVSNYIYIYIYISIIIIILSGNSP